MMMLMTVEMRFTISKIMFASSVELDEGSAVMWDVMFELILSREAGGCR